MREKEKEKISISLAILSNSEFHLLSFWPIGIAN